MDLDLLYRINQVWQTGWLDQLMPAMSALNAWIPLFAIVAVAVAIWGGFRGRACLVVLAVTIAIGDGVIARTLKKATDRPRPHQVVYGLTVRDIARGEPAAIAAFREPREKPSQPKRFYQEGRAFPSAHVVNVFAAATVAVMFFGRRWWWLYLPAAAVAYSRVYVGSHWPSDILPSVAIGLLCGTFIPLAADALWRKLGHRLSIRLARLHPTLFP
ncbi:hypothetical protein BH23VER1_BH23VER1_31240 [soil metagenome]